MQRNILSIFARITLFPSLLRMLDGVNNPIIVSYHNPTPQIMRKHLEWYKSRFTFISLDELVDSLASKTKLPDRSLVITFDDGHKNNYDLIDLFKEFNIRPTIYVCSGLVDTTRKFWFKIVDNPQPFKKMKHIDRLQALKEQYSYDLLNEYGDQERDVLTKKELLELSEFADIGCHTRFHPILTTLNEIELIDEIFGAKKELELLSGRTVNHFSYPNGDFGDLEKKIVKEAGYKSCRTINCDIISKGTDPFELPVIGVDDRDTVNMLAVQISRLPKRFSNFVRKGVFSGKYDPIIIVK